MLLRVVDIETTGFEPPDHAVCEVGWADVVATQRDLTGAPAGWEVVGAFGSHFVDPGRPIPPITVRSEIQRRQEEWEREHPAMVSTEDEHVPF